jgi:hypothetical protein
MTVPHYGRVCREKRYAAVMHDALQQDAARCNCSHQCTRSPAGGAGDAVVQTP